MTEAPLPKDVVITTDRCREAIRELQTSILHLTNMARALSTTLTMFETATPRPMEEMWVDRYGETMTKVKAAEALGRSIGHLNTLIRTGIVETDPEGRVITRSMCRWACGTKEPTAKQTGTKFRVTAK